MNHDDLVNMAKRWLLKRCVVVVTEMTVGYGNETPDAIGWEYSGWSTMIECKISRADFLRDKKKKSRKEKVGIGNMRYYLAPKGIINTAELPARWGLLEYIDKKSLPRTIRKALNDFDYNPKYGAEILLLISCLRRIGGLRDGISVKCYQFPSENRATLGIKREGQMSKKKENPFKEFLNECSEWHALWIGVVKSWIRLKMETLPKELQKDVKKEYHYYLFGFFLSKALQLGLIIFLIIKFLTMGSKF